MEKERSSVDIGQESSEDDCGRWTFVLTGQSGRFGMFLFCFDIGVE